MLPRQDVATKDVADFPSSAVARRQREGSFLGALRQEGRPERLQLGASARIQQFVQVPPDDLIPGLARHDARAETGVNEATVVIDDED